MHYQSEHFRLSFSLALTGFKHVGVFPEQAANWEYIYRHLKNCSVPEPKFLNLFAYTGGASLAAKAAGADVTHVDSIKQVVSWARRNMELSGLENIRWVVEDAVKFARREVKRGKKYNGIILDPPAFGHGPDGESWVLEKQINDLLKDVLQLLDPKEHFLIINTYSLGFSSLIIKNLMNRIGPSVGLDIEPEAGEIYLPANSGVKLPLGVYCRFGNI
jgi:23S rRNA (cytosine1962-C5)-methyltransferase